MRERRLQRLVVLRIHIHYIKYYTRTRKRSRSLKMSVWSPNEPHKYKERIRHHYRFYIFSLRVVSSLPRLRRSLLCEKELLHFLFVFSSGSSHSQYRRRERRFTFHSHVDVVIQCGRRKDKEEEKSDPVAQKRFARAR